MEARMKTPLTIGIVASVMQIACMFFVHGSHREAVAVVSGQAAGSAWLGWLVVLAEMVSVLVLPPIILAAVFGCILHLIKPNRAFQSREAGR
jgi:hypothetical protein